MWIAYIILGVLAGVVGGMFGVGGGIIMVPALVYLFGFSQHQAQGTSLGVLVPPVVIFAALKYYSNGYINMKIALFICIGFFLGAFLGASIVQPISDITLKRMFGCLLLFVSLRMIISK